MSLSRIDNPPNPWSATEVDWIGEPPTQALEVFRDHSRSILSRNQSPDLPFEWSLNPYRGCVHACAYCYARPSHQYLDMGAGTDFDRRIIVKEDAPRLLEESFQKRSWKGKVILFSGNTDCYQPLEAGYGLTRQCLEVCLRYRNPVQIITKAPLIERDLELLCALHEVTNLTVTMSIPFWNADHARAMEPGVPPPQRRMETVQKLTMAGLNVGVNCAPVIPGLNDAELVDILEAASTAGAGFAGAIMLRLPGPVAEIFEARLRRTLPLRAKRVMKCLQDVRAGKINDARFGSRMQGEGPYAAAVMQLFRQSCIRLGLAVGPTVQETDTFRPPPRPGSQMSLFDG